MDPEYALLLTATRLAQHLTGHERRCGCQECCLFSKLLRADYGLRLAISYLTVDVRTEQKRNLALEALTGEIPSPPGERR